MLSPAGPAFELYPCDSANCNKQVWENLLDSEKDGFRLKTSRTSGTYRRSRYSTSCVSFETLDILFKLVLHCGSMSSLLDERLSIAPMVEWTDPHFRMLMRGITRKTVLYTEMVVDETVLNTPSLDFMIGRNIDAAPSVIQMGGSNPEALAKATERCEEYSQGQYGEINLNCGCPSQRVAKKCFGAKLMMEPELVREIVNQMQRRSSVPVTVKCRIGVDERDSYQELTHFIRCANEGGAQKFVIHARKCLLNGLTTKQNRDIPPLHYEVVHKLVQDFPGLVFVINGGLQTLDQAEKHFDEYDFALNKLTSPLRSIYTVPATDASSIMLDPRAISSAVETYQDGGNTLQSLQTELIERLPGVHGAMIGRAAYSNPLLFATADSTFYGVPDPCLTRREVIERYIRYCEWCQSGDGPRRIVKGGKEQQVSTMVLLNAMRNVICGIKNVTAYRQALNDEYMRLVKTHPNPCPRTVVSSFDYLSRCFSHLTSEFVLYFAD